MSISDEDLARELRRARNMTGSWADMGEPIRFAWFAVAAKARELLTPDMQMPPLPGSLGPLQPGDVVSVRGVVHEIDPPHPQVSVRLDGYMGASLGAHGWIKADEVTLIERPAPIEPDWTPGDVAKSSGPKGDGTLYRYWPDGPSPSIPWLSLHKSRLPRWVNRTQIPGTLTPCDVVPREAK